jgi:hypothetical protein
MDTAGNVLTGLSIPLLSYAIVLGANKIENQAFQQYKSILFTAAMFLILGLAGLPFLPRDPVQSSPSMHILASGLGIAALMGCIVIYVMNLSLETFLLYVASLVSIAAIVGKFRGEGGPPVKGTEIPSAAKEALVGATAVAFFLGTGKVAQQYQGSAIPWLRQVATLYTYAAPVGIWGTLAFLVYRAIRSLAETRASNTVPVPVPAHVARFEGFQATATATAPAPVKAPSLLERLDAAIGRLQDTVSRLIDFSDSTCSIVRDVELGYMGARSAPKDESELSLPAEVQKTRKAQRQETAKKSFLTLRKINASSMNTRILECFQGAQEEDVREYCIQLEGLLENADTLAQIAVGQSMAAELVFADRMIQKAEAFQNAAALAPTPTPDPSESIAEKYAVLSGTALTAAAERLLQKEYQIYTFAEQLEKGIDTLQGKINKTAQKASMLTTGNYNRMGPSAS